MRLVHAVLLPGIVVFVSKATLLQAHALRRDVADDPVSDLRTSGVEATALHESRMNMQRVEQLVEHSMKNAGMITRSVRDGAKDELATSFHDLYREWLLQHAGESANDFFAHEDGQKWLSYLNTVNELLSSKYSFNRAQFMYVDA